MQIHPDYKTKPVKGSERHEDQILEALLSKRSCVKVKNETKLQPSKDYKRRN